MLHSSFMIQRRVASGLPLHVASYADYVRGNDAMNVRPISRAQVRGESKRRPVAVVTGGNGGIGWWNVLDLSFLGYDVLLCCRNRRRGEDAIEKILRIHQRRQHERNAANDDGVCCGTVTFVALDLEDESSIRSAAATVMQRTDNGAHLQVLINNAGMFSPSLGQRTSFGDERLVGVNFTGVVLFTELILRATLAHRRGGADEAPPLRIVNVASIAHSWARVTHANVLNLFSESIKLFSESIKIKPESQQGPTVNTYGFSKLLLIAYTRALATSLKGNTKANGVVVEANGVVVVSVHPGAVLTDIFRELGVIASHVMPVVLSTIFKQPAEGAETTLFAALSQHVQNGSYYADCCNMDAALSPIATDDDLSQAVLHRARARWGLTATF
ncbi:short chain dehydrogenase, putative [Bodo saltans]|uniref:Short chain dehydrogenase, putative n=1 Tax=Bodo saltans TaxID=75058 RepID=A0A0S4JBQ4_BODSA|nr:short chain dehydrogenase, putative [Bodo saltans]|eukprot:CUG87704.1 short chain dehydrogenase, putative [Bodo saltans]